MNKGDEIICRAASLAYGGEAVIKHKDLTGFVRGLLPGESAKIQITEIKKNFFRGRLVAILEPSWFRTTPPCPYFNICGGCVYQHLAYEKQIETKQNQLQELLRHLGKISDAKISRIIPSPLIFNYRNHLTFKLKSKQLGFISADNKTFVPVEECKIAKDAINNKIAEIKKELSKGMRIKEINGEIIVKCGADNTIDYAFSESISSKGNYKLLHEEINGKIYYFSLAVFFQVNPYILSLLLHELKNSLNLSPETTLFDIYSGTGLFSIYLSPYIKNSYGIEVNENAVKLAEKSAEANNIKNCGFFTGEAEDIAPEIFKNHKGKRNILILDPPRQGLNREILYFLKEIITEGLVYISCEPSRLTRDLQFLLQNGYELHNIILADMFPQTKHMETIAILSHL